MTREELIAKLTNIGDGAEWFACCDAADMLRADGEEIERLRKLVDTQATSMQFDAQESREAKDEIERLKRDNHNLNWALGSPGYDQMATPEEEAGHVAAVANVTANIERMRLRKERHDALVPGDEDYLDVIERLRKERDEARAALAAATTMRPMSEAAPDMLDMLHIVLPYIEDAERDPAYKQGAVATITKQLRDLIAQATGDNE